MALGNKETMAANLKYYMRLNGVDRNKLVDDLNLKYMTVSDWINAKTYPRIDKIEMLAHYFGINKSDLIEDRIDTPDLITIYNRLDDVRKGNLLNVAEQLLEEQTNQKVRHLDLYEDYLREETETVYIYGTVSAGKGSLVSDQAIEEIQCHKPVPIHDMAFKVVGDSMTPLFQDGEVIFTHKTSVIGHGQIGVFIVNGEAYVKKLFKTPHSVSLVSLNKDYPDIELTENDQIEVVGTVIL